MAKPRLSFLLILSISCMIMGTVEPSFARRSKSRAYVEASCRSTRYPELCIQSLSGFTNTTELQSPQQLAHIALSVSLYKARYTRSYLFKVCKELKAIKAKDYQTVQDCLEQINSGIVQLTQSIKELRCLSQKVVNDDSLLRINNVETWVSAALTDASTCVEQFPGRNMSKLKATIKGKVLNVEQVTSNALALFHQFAVRYRASATKKP
ncbi:pectinesterase inhibitor 9-like [Pistacia vera]|uniref:pectinesterase inhibitor 9-like n=1 Tax=Pistacia vera TaxID=55513 RepID=UPI001263389D|nr:pectinesterase inhibitor 9-like [Pistacia vera]XP_031269668.1 pectinesterase inhibitor 9-like [Pistacia vera]